MTRRVPAALDHLVLAVPDLARGIADVESRLGVGVLPGGRHPAWGTRNAIVPLDRGAYLEVIGPDPERIDPAPPTLFGLDRLTAPRLAAWAARSSDLPAIVARAAGAGLDVGAVQAGERRRPDDVLLRWRLTDPFRVPPGSAMPIFIDWLDTPHPSAAAPAVVRLTSLRAEHPAPAPIRVALDALGLDLQVDAGPRARLVATLVGPAGSVTLA
ncbi:MAG: VOC family protein [Vicinamibacterales bacterium]